MSGVQPRSLCPGVLPKYCVPQLPQQFGGVGRHRLYLASGVSWKCSVTFPGSPINPDFRKLKLTHNGAKVPDESTEIRKVHCEVFFPLPLATAESHCTALLGSSAQLFEPLQR